MKSDPRWIAHIAFGALGAQVLMALAAWMFWSDTGTMFVDYGKIGPNNTGIAYSVPVGLFLAAVIFLLNRKK